MHEEFVRFYREGRLQDARRICMQALAAADVQDANARLMWAYACAMLERRAGRLPEALCLHLLAHTHVAAATDGCAIGKHLNGLSLTYKQLFEKEREEEYFEKAQLGFEAARGHFEGLDDAWHVAAIDNNLGALFLSAGRAEEAHAYFTLARDAFLRLGDIARVAEVDDSRARAYLQQGKLREAFASGSASISALLGTEEQLALQDSLTTIERVTEALKHSSLPAHQS